MYVFFAAASNPISKVIFGSVGIDFEKWNGGSKSFIMWKLHHYVGPLRLTGGSNCGKNVKYFSRPFYCQGGPSSNMGQYCNAGGEPLVTLLKQSTELRTRYWQLQVHWPQETYEKLWWWLFLFWALEKTYLNYDSFFIIKIRKSLSEECDSLHSNRIFLVSNSTLMSLKWLKSRFDLS